MKELCDLPYNCAIRSGNLSLLLILVLAVCFFTERIGDELALGVVEVASLE
jgi:hypothetical protein